MNMASDHTPSARSTLDQPEVLEATAMFMGSLSDLRERRHFAGSLPAQ
jgi:hypothetical protein